MGRPITLFTGQWADLPFEQLCALAGEWGYDGLEIACWGDHFEVDRALADDSYVPRKRELLAAHGLQVFAISNHLVGQAVCDHPIDTRHRAILPPRIWGDGEPEGVRQPGSGSRWRCTPARSRTTSGPRGGPWTRSGTGARSG